MAVCYMHFPHELHTRMMGFTYSDTAMLFVELTSRGKEALNHSPETML